MTLSHKDIKTYTFAESAVNHSDFALKRIDELYRKSNGAADVPHRHDYYTILFIEKGQGTHFVDFMEYNIQDGTIYFIMPGQMHQVIFTAEPKGWVITYTDHFLISNSIPDKMINDIYLFNDYGQSPPLPINDRDLPVYISLVEQMFHFSQALESYTLEAVGALVKLFLIQSNNHCSLRKSNNPQLMETSKHLLRSFKQLLNKKFASAHMVSDYADELAVTADYLNKTVKNLTGKSAKEHIQSKLITEAKRSLLFSNVSSKELSYELGFEESAHFNNFFKKITGQTPSEFRTVSRQS
jgi:AraC-like DNA-binding protein/mannose-6-phosphate isomerase-like protein (cupin superfamily)